MQFQQVGGSFRPNPYSFKARFGNTEDTQKPSEQPPAETTPEAKNNSAHAAPPRREIRIPLPDNKMFLGTADKLKDATDSTRTALGNVTEQAKKAAEKALENATPGVKNMAATLLGFFKGAAKTTKEAAENLETATQKTIESLTQKPADDAPEAEKPADAPTETDEKSE